MTASTVRLRGGGMSSHVTYTATITVPASHDPVEVARTIRRVLGNELPQGSWVGVTAREFEPERRVAA